MDDFLFHSATLRAGSTVSFRVTADLHSLVSATSPGDCSSVSPQPSGLASFQMLYNNGNQYGGRMFNPLVHSTCGLGSDEMTFTGDFQSTVGGDFAVRTIFNTQSGAFLSLLRTATFDSTVDASDTGNISVEVLTPGVTFSSASGALYRAVPEPPTLLLFCSGLMGLTGVSFSLKKRSSFAWPRRWTSPMRE
jgi:hypothetical protein